MSIHIGIRPRIGPDHEPLPGRAKRKAQALGLTSATWWNRYRHLRWTNGLSLAGEGP